MQRCPKRLPPPGVRVNYQRQYHTCHKPYCRTCREGKGHGPYLYAYWREQGRLYSCYLGKTLPPEAPHHA